LFEPNNASTRLRVASLLDNFLSTVSGGGGLEAYSVVVDETNNTAQDIDNNLLNISIYIQPTRNIEFIQLQVIITRTGVAFSEI
jgi:phage tail sheath protein FI